MDANGISMLRSHLLVRNSRRLEVQRRFDAFDRRAVEGEKMTVVTVFCTAGSKGHHPALAKTWVVQEGLLFSSRIKWWSQDRVRMQPWRIDALLNRAAVDFDLTDDAAVKRCGEMIAGLRSPDPDLPNDRYWLLGEPDFYLQDVLDLPGEATDGWLPDLWVRCKDHPGERKALDREELVRAAGPAYSPRRYPSATIQDQVQKSGPAALRRTT